LGEQRSQGRVLLGKCLQTRYVGRKCKVAVAHHQRRRRIDAREGDVVTSDQRAAIDLLSGHGRALRGARTRARRWSERTGALRTGQTGGAGQRQDQQREAGLLEHQLLILCGPREMVALPMRRVTIVAAVLSAVCGCASARSYHNPILYADYSDPDVVRVGSEFYLVASSFHFSPGIPILHSRDLVHWTIVAHALARLDFHPSYDLPGPLDFDDTVERSRMNYSLGYRYASGVWAPAIRAHAGRLYIYFPTPTEGIFMTSAPRAAGPWDPPVKVIDEPGLEDPCPFWDDDGQAYLVHSRVGAGPLVLHRMSADG